jgi:molybdopterin-guanine dinucleotide biosynthesis protein A
MTLLGAVLAGGKSSRFGSDKAEALLEGRPLIAHAVAALKPWCDEVVVIGHASDDARTVPDWPQPGLGPLGGLAGALAHALERGHHEVLSIPVDCVTLPPDLLELLRPAPAYLAAQPVIGLWRARAAGALEELLFGNGSHAVRAFADRIEARGVTTATPPANVNTPQDLARLEKHHGL